VVNQNRFSASTFVVKIGTFAKPENVKGKFYNMGEENKNKIPIPPARLANTFMPPPPPQKSNKNLKLRKNLSPNQKSEALRLLNERKKNKEISEAQFETEKIKILTDFEFQIHLEDISDEFLLKTLETDIELSQSEQNLSAILAGFSLGSVVALLFIESSILVSIMFACSIVASWLFIFTTLHKTFLLESLRTNFKYFDFYFEIEDKYNLIRKAHLKSKYWDILFFIAFLNFIIVLICASFLIHFIFGILGTLLCVILTILLYKNMMTLKFEKYYFEWKNLGEYDKNLPLTAHNRH